MLWIKLSVYTLILLSIEYTTQLTVNKAIKAFFFKYYSKLKSLKHSNLIWFLLLLSSNFLTNIF